MLQQSILSLGDADLLALVEHSLANTPPDIELATIAYDEAGRRKRHQVIREAREIFDRKGIRPIPWLSLAKQTLSLLVLPPAGNYQGHLYVILVDGYTEQNQFYGVYVGSSRYTPETRFQQHKVGYKSSGLVRNRGIQVLRSLCWPDGKTVPGGRDLVLWESALNRCLALVVPKVRGDHIPIDDWDDTFQYCLQGLLDADIGLMAEVRLTLVACRTRIRCGQIRQHARSARTKGHRVPVNRDPFRLEPRRSKIPIIVAAELTLQ